jgi:O-antigen ligase
MKLADLSPTLSGRRAAPWLLIALTPLIFAALTSNPFNPGSGIQDLLRRYGIPIVAIEISVIGLAVFSGLRPVSRLLHAPWWISAALGALFLVALGTALAANHPAFALLHFHFWLIHLLFGLSVACLAETAPQRVRDYFWPAVVVGLILWVFLLALYVALIPDPTSFNWRRFGFAVTNIRHIGYFTVVGIAASTGLALVQNKMPLALATASAASLFFAVAFWSGSRGAPLAVWIAFVCSMIWLRCLRTRRTVITVAAISVIGLMLSRLHEVPDKHFGLTRIAQSLGGTTVEGVTSSRLGIWRATWDAIAERPLFGHGQGQFGSTVPEARGLEINHPHNLVLQITFDWGVVGAICFAAIFLYFIWGCLKAVSDNPGRQLPAFLVCASLITMSFYDGAFFFTYPIMMSIVALAWIAGTEAAPPLPNSRSRRPE